MEDRGVPDGPDATHASEKVLRAKRISGYLLLLLGAVFMFVPRNFDGPDMSPLRAMFNRDTQEGWQEKCFHLGRVVDGATIYTCNWRSQGEDDSDGLSSEEVNYEWRTGAEPAGPRFGDVIALAVDDVTGVGGLLVLLALSPWLLAIRRRSLGADGKNSDFLGKASEWIRNQTSATGLHDTDAIGRLQRLEQLRESGLITQYEFNKRRKAILEEL
jgi:hypothetical protein